MQNWIISIMNRFGYIGVAGLIGLENIFPPIPSEVILTFGGFMTTCSDLTFTGVVLSSTIGSLLGAILLYGLGWILSYEKLCRILSGKTGKILHLFPEDIDKAVSWFDKKGNVTVFFCRFIPIVRSLISIPAGCAKMKMLPFLLLTTAGSFIWNTVLVYLGALAGRSWSRIAGYMDTYSSIVLIVLVIILISALYSFIKNRTKET
ncbi:MAG: DedA family protein [Suilimivivens sp.]